ncbi:MAG TPA: TIGR03936 family radical SAM-associated protein [Propionibacteriaceae bacterium]|nr:TIGR03936 family radical SAM-associated protein [Propionibacteriaceae bacterium]
MTPREQPEQQAPPVQRLRVRYAKRGPARFTSHRDFSRAFERALRRAEVPMAYSSGYSPHPRISYANASPTSAATEAEYLEIGLAQMCDPSLVRDALDAALPPGLVILTVVEADRTSFADLLTASTWSVDMGDVDADVLASAVERLLASDEVHITRMTKSGLRDFDVRAAVIELAVVDDRTLRLVSLQQTPLVRPDDVVAALRKVEPRLDTGRPALLLRIDQGRLVDGAMVAPF